jgi:hypothetical protein
MTYSKEVRQALSEGKSQFEILMHGCWNNVVKNSNFDSEDHEMNEFCLTDASYDDVLQEVAAYLKLFIFRDLDQITVTVPTNLQGKHKVHVINFFETHGKVHFA